MKQVALLFPGIGSEFVGMGKSFYDNFAIARDTFTEASDSLGFDMAKLCFESELSNLQRPIHSQPAMLTVNMAGYRIYRQEIGIRPLCCAGHSSGEVSALTCAGVIKFPDVVKLVHWCGGYIPEAVPPEAGAMALISGVEPQVVAAECLKISQPGNLIVISNYNSFDQMALSGHRQAVREVCQQLKAMRAIVVFLKSPVPFHSPLLKSVSQEFQKEMAKYPIGKMEFMVISNQDGLPYSDEEKVPEKLGRQMMTPVQWQTSMQYIAGLGVEAAVEIGPLPLLKNLMKKNAPQIATLSLHKTDDLHVLREFFADQPQTAPQLNQSRPPETNQPDPAVFLELKKRLTGIVRLVFDCETINDEAHFSELGSDSILLLKLQEALENQFPGMVDVSDLFSYPTIKKLTGFIYQKTNKSHPPQGFSGSKNSINEVLAQLMRGEITVEEADKLIP